MTARGAPPIPFSPFDERVIADPYPHYARLRRDDPVHHNPELGLWVLSTHDDVRAAARDHRHFRSGNGVSYARMQIPMMLTMDPPDHERLRRFVSRDFAPRSVPRWQPLIDRLIDELTADLPDRFEMVSALSAPLPVRLIAGVLGVPDSDYPIFKRWSDDIVRGFALTDMSQLPPESMQAVLELNQYVLALLAERREEPRDDLLSLLMRERDGEQLDDMEITFFFLLLLVAGNETTTNLVSNLLHELATHPEQWAHLRDGRAAVEAATEEALRYAPPIQGFFRDAADGAVVGDTTIPDGDRVLLLWASANRDENHYDSPEHFDVRRRVEDHMAFGHGIHVCLGAHLARLEVHAVLRCLLVRFERLEPDGDPMRTNNPTLRGFEQLPLRGHRA